MADLSVSRLSNSSPEELLRQQVLYGLNTTPAPVQGTETTQTAEAVQQSQAAEAQKQEEEDTLSEQEKDAFSEAIQQLDELIKPLSIGLNVTRIEALNRLYVQLFDRDTGEVLREIPPRKILEMQENIRAFQGLLFDKFS
ncbi:MAG: flagellar protein FlaG [Candidatus Sericytochromatia bacterium]